MLLVVSHGNHVRDMFRGGLNNAHELLPQVSPTQGVRNVPKVKNELIPTLQLPLHQEGVVLRTPQHGIAGAGVATRAHVAPGGELDGVVGTWNGRCHEVGFVRTAATLAHLIIVPRAGDEVAEFGFVKKNQPHGTSAPRRSVAGASHMSMFVYVVEEAPAQRVRVKGKG